MTVTLVGTLHVDPWGIPWLNRTTQIDQSVNLGDLSPGHHTFQLGPVSVYLGAALEGDDLVVEAKGALFGNIPLFDEKRTVAAHVAAGPVPITYGHPDMHGQLDFKGAITISE